MTVLDAEHTVADELALPFDDTATVARRDLYFGSMVRQLVSLGISLVIGALLYFVFRWNSDLIWFFYIAFGSYRVLKVIYALVRWLLARRMLKKQPWGSIAVGVDRGGIQVAGTGMSWAEVTSMRAYTPWWTSIGRLELNGIGQATTGVEMAPPGGTVLKAVVRLDHLPVEISTVESAVETLSDYRVRLNTQLLNR